MNHDCILRDMKMFVCFLCGAAMILSFNALRGADPSHHVYELRLYHVHEGKMDALKARFGDHTHQPNHAATRAQGVQGVRFRTA